MATKTKDALVLYMVANMPEVTVSNDDGGTKRTGTDLSRKREGKEKRKGGAKATSALPCL